jgi:Ca2+/Na+ antiporter
MNISDQLKEIFTAVYDFTVVVFQPLFDLIIKYYHDNPLFIIVLAFVPVLLGIAYPLMIQTISRLNDQYKSTHIIERFKKERLHILFIWCLRVSVFLTILCFVLSLQVFLLAFISVVLLLFLFFLYLKLLLQYQNGKDLFRLYLSRLKIDFYLKNRERKKGIAKQKNKILEYWHPIIDLFLFSINNKDRKLENDILDFFIYKVFNFIKYSDQGGRKTVLFPTELYNSTFDIIYTYIKNNERDYYQNIEAFVGSIYFTENFGKLKPQYFHLDTLIAIWRNLVLIVEHQRGDKIIDYWRSAHQYCSFNLEIHRVEFDDNFKETEKSIDKRTKIKKFREAFIQLHTVLGAYLMHKKDYKTLKEIWFFTQSQPPSVKLSII